VLSDEMRSRRFAIVASCWVIGDELYCLRIERYFLFVPGKVDQEDVEINRGQRMCRVQGVGELVSKGRSRVYEIDF